MADKPKLKPLLGMRVVNLLDQRTGLVVGKPETMGTRYSLIPVTVESSTRTELWPEHWIEFLPKRQQFPAHGGRFQAPAGYPLRVQ